MVNLCRYDIKQPLTYNYDACVQVRDKCNTLIMHRVIHTIDVSKK